MNYDNCVDCSRENEKELLHISPFSLLRFFLPKSRSEEKGRRRVKKELKRRHRGQMVMRARCCNHHTHVKDLSAKSREFSALVQNPGCAPERLQSKQESLFQWVKAQRSHQTFTRNLDSWIFPQIVCVIVVIGTRQFRFIEPFERERGKQQK